MSYLDSFVSLFASVFDIIRHNEIGLVMVGLGVLVCVICSVRRLVCF